MSPKPIRFAKTILLFGTIAVTAARDCGRIVRRISALMGNASFHRVMMGFEMAMKPMWIVRETALPVKMVNLASCILIALAGLARVVFVQLRPVMTNCSTVMKQMLIAEEAVRDVELEIAVARAAIVNRIPVKMVFAWLAFAVMGKKMA